MAEEEPCTLSHHFPEYSQYLVEQLNLQKYYGAFCDVVVRVEDVDFRLHKCVLAGASSKLQAMLYNMRQECGNLLTLEEITINGFRVIMDFMYSGVLKVESAYMQDVLAAAQYLDIREVEKTCLELMSHIGMPSVGDPQQHLRAMAFASGIMETQSATQPQASVGGTTLVSSSSSANTNPQIQIPVTIVPAVPQSPSAPVSLSDLPVTTTMSSPDDDTQTTSANPNTSQLQPQTLMGTIGGMSVDTNYIEDYLKLIESLQGEPGAQQIAFSKAGQNQSQLERGMTINTSSADSIIHSRSDNPAMSHLSTSSHSHTPSTTVSSNHHRKSVAAGRTVQDNSAASTSGVQNRTTVPTNLYSAEDVRRTILSVLSQEKFDDGDDEDGGKVDDKDNVPLTALLNMDPVQGESGRSTGHEAADGQTNLVNSSASDNSEEDHHEGDDKNQSDHLDCRLREPQILTQEPKPSPPAKSVQPKQKRKIKKPMRVDRKSVADVTCSDTEGNANEVQTVINKKKSKKNKKRSKSVPSDITDKESFISEDGIKTKPLKKRLKMRMRRKNVCEKCGREFYKQESLDKHMELHNLSKLHSCHICCQKFARACELTRHLRSHTSLTFRCGLCCTDYTEPSPFRQHMVTVHRDTKPFICQYMGCGFRSAKLSNVEKHSVIHSDVKGFQCHMCGKSFSQANGLRSHTRSCTEQRSYLCDICGAKFNHLQSMKNHRLLHTGEKPHTCEECGARFTDHRNYKRHKRIHENVFPYPCSICDKKFRHSNSLKAHLQTHVKQMGSNNFKLNTFDALNLDFKSPDLTK